MFSVSAVVSNSSAISGVAGSSEVLENVTARVIHETTKRMIDLRHVGRSKPGECGCVGVFWRGGVVAPGDGAEDSTAVFSGSASIVAAVKAQLRRCDYY